MQSASWRQAALFVVCGTALLMTSCGGGGEREVDVVTYDSEGADLQSVVLEAVDGPARTLAETPFEFAWDLVLPRPAHTSWMSPNLRDVLFVQLTSGEIQAINVFSGITLWVTRALPKLIDLPPHVHTIERLNTDTGETFLDSRLYVISGDELYNFDCTYGQLIWSYHIGNSGPHGFQPSSGPMAHGELANLRVFMGDWEGRIQTVAFNQPYQRPYGLWQWNLKAVPSAQPEGFEGLIYVGDQAGTFSCFTLDRDLQWQYQTEAPILGSSLVRGFSVFFGADDNILYALDRRSGEERGRLYLGAPVRHKPMAFNGDRKRIYVFTSGDEAQAGLRAIDSTEDSISLEDFDRTQAGFDKKLNVTRMSEGWHLTGISRVVGSSPKRIYATRKDSSVVLAIDRHSGTVDWHWDVDADVDGEVTHMTSYVDPTDVVRAIITITDSGQVTAHRLFGAEYIAK